MRTVLQSKCHEASFGHTATSLCQRKEGLQRVRPDMGFREWSNQGNLDEVKEQEDEFIGSHTQQSPHASDTSDSNSSTFESFSFSYKSEASAFVKGELSPTETGLIKPAKLSSASLETCVGARLGAGSIETMVVSSRCSKPVGKRMQRQEVARQDFMEFTFLNGWMVENPFHEGGTHGSSATVGSGDSEFGEEPLLEHDATSIEFSDEEWADGLVTPAFYSASACSPDSCSEDSYHSSDTNNSSWINNEFMHCPITELRDRQQGSHADLGHWSWDAELQDQASLSQLQHSMELCQHKEPENQGTLILPSCAAKLPVNNPNFQHAPFEADIHVDRVLTKCNAHPTKTSGISDVAVCMTSNFLEGCSLHPVLNQQEEGFSFQPLILWNESGAKINGYLSLTSSSNMEKDGMGEKGTLVHHHCIDADFFMPSERILEREMSRRQGLDQLPCDRPILALQPLCHHFQKVTKALPLSPLSFSKAKHIERPNKPTRKKRNDILLPGTSKSQPSILPFAKTHWNWRSKSLAARTIVRSAVRNFELAFARSRSMPLPKTQSQTPQNDLKTENSSLLDRVFVSPLRSHHKHVENLKPLHRTIYPDYNREEEFQQGRRVPLSRDAQSLVCTQRSLSMDSNSNSTTALANPVASPLPLTCYKHRRTDLDISRNLFLPTSQSIHCLPAPKGVLGPGNPVSCSQKQELPNLQSDGAPSSMVHGYLQCLWRDGVSSYTLMIDDSEEMLVARPCTSENHSNKEGSKWVYTFHSQRSKAKGKRAGGWKSWKRKDKIVADLAGKMKVSSVLCPEVGSGGEIRHSLVSEFVLFDGRSENAVRSQSLRFWSSDVACQNGPTAAGSMKETAMPLSQISVPFFSLSKLQMPEKRLTGSLTDATVALETVGKQTQLSSPTKGIVGHRPSFSLDISSNTELIDPEVCSLSHCPSHMELAAIVVRVPPKEHKKESKVGDCHSKHDALGWNRKVLDISSISEATRGVQALSRALSLSAVNREKYVKYGTIPTAQLAGTEWSHMASTMTRFDQQPLRDTCADTIFKNVKPGEINTTRMAHSWDASDKAEYAQHDRLRRAAACVTIILPKGDHGLPNGESSGPSPLIERWRSGGKCNCGGWDLGCGLTVLSTESSNNSVVAKSNTIQTLSQKNPLNIFSQGSRQEVTLSLSVVQPGLFMLTFQARLSPLRAFATAVAILHSKNPLPPGEATIKTGNCKERPPRTLANLSRPKFKVEDKTASTFRNLRSPFDPPLSPFGRI